MIKHDTEPPYRRPRSLLVLLAVTAVIGGAQVLTPASAPALQTDGCSEGVDAAQCAQDDGGAGGGDPANPDGDAWEQPSEPGSDPAGNGPGQQSNVTDDGNNTDSHQGPVRFFTLSDEDQRINDWVKKDGSDLPDWITDDKRWGEAMFKRARHKLCGSLLRSVKSRIRQLGEGEEEFDFDWIKNPSDKRLRKLESSFDSEDCGDALGVPY